MRPVWHGWGAAAFLTLALLLGGSTSGGAIPNAILQFVAALLLAASVMTGRGTALVGAERSLLTLALVVPVIAMLQLIPLPAGIWTHLGGRANVARGFALIGAPPPALPISLWPAATLASLVWVLPILAGLRLIMNAGPGDVRRLAWALVIVAAASFMLGFFQLVGGQQSPLYLYHLTNRDQLVGFMANSNHLATLGVMTLPFLAALAARDRDPQAPLHRDVGQWTTLGGFAVFIVLGVVADGSLAGILLLVPSLIGSAIIFRVERRRIALPLIGGLLVVTFGLLILIATASPVLNGFAMTDVSVGANSRAEIYRNALHGLRDMFPAGSGLGSFLMVYPLYAPGHLASGVYVNHAHNDYIEFVLETGVAGLVVMAAFLVWWVRQAWFAWREAGQRARFARAATVASAMLMAHSLVDYPGRTAALGVLFAICCAIMARPLSTVTGQLFADTAQRTRGKMVEVDG